MTAERWTRAVGQRLGLGRLLPLGHRRDGAWITEEAAGAVLRRAAAGVPGVRLGALRVSLTDPEQTYEPAVPPPPGALPPGPLRVTGEFAASADPSAPGGEPLPAAAARLRSALAAAATERLGLMVTEVDLRVTGLLDTDAPPPVAVDHGDRGPAEPGPAGGRAPVGGPIAGAGPGPVGGADSAEVARVTAAVLSVPGVDGLAGALGRPVRFAEVRGTDPALPRRHVRVEVAVSAAGRAADVARAVRARVAEALPDVPSVAVLVTDVR
ncbi:nucleopolyhedrovirus P10 family protein [Streptomyces fagopyri]|uniref:Nucleopolyhedrovirus P10 family protein n=1 Tax=Streptomyces fagopyri TaxID=2662397 RepID=A0A5Q0LIT0_9ACTN|nr:nucleopolyhedrovirus P10 family protein [Streptomyces fagopyri]QFZ77112.1 nucleopolyhedrovirus P10 family protein [Streptomyces fagopyri]